MSTGDDSRVHEGADVEADAEIGPGVVVWDGAKVRAGATVGAGTKIGRHAFVDAGVRIGENCKLQGNCLVYAPATLGNGVFVGPAAVLTNDRFPRAVSPDGKLLEADDWHAEAVTVGDGASIGAGAVVVAGVTIGPWAMIAAGAIVTRAVAAHELVAGIPARRIGWVGRTGVRLEEAQPGWRCPVTGERYQETARGLERVP